MEHEAHNPALLHHFADAQQQKNAASLGMWLFLVTEIMFFGGMFCAYLSTASPTSTPSRLEASSSASRWEPLIPPS